MNNWCERVKRTEPRYLPSKMPRHESIPMHQEMQNCCKFPEKMTSMDSVILP